VKVSKEGVYAMTDEEIAHTLREIQKTEVVTDTINLSEWERTFLATAPMAWAEHDGFTWKQRRAARLLILKVIGVLERRASL